MIVLVAPDLASAFAGARTVVVPNGVDPDMLSLPPTPAPGARRLVYVGTLSPRFDAPLIAASLHRLPGWRLDLYGAVSVPGMR